MVLLITLSLSSTAYAQTSSDDSHGGGADVREIKRATLVTGETKTTGFWISQPGLALLVAEIKARGQSNQVLGRALELHRSQPPPQKKPAAKAFLWGLGAGVGLGALLVGGLVLGL